MEQLDKGIALANAGKIILAQPYETSTVEYRLFNLASKAARLSLTSGLHSRHLSCIILETAAMLLLAGYLLLKGNASFIAMGGGGCKWWPECTHSHSSHHFSAALKA